MGMCGGDNDAAEQARKDKKERERRTARAVGRINDIFSDPERTSQYQDLAEDTTHYYRSQLDRAKAVNDRKLKFAMARMGQTGGSVQADQARKLGKDYLSGVLRADRRGQNAAAKLRTSDQQAQADLIAMARSGMNATTAAQNAASMLRSNLESASSNARRADMASTFSDFSDLYKRSRQKAALRDSMKNAYQLIYSPGFGAGAPRG